MVLASCYADALAKTEYFFKALKVLRSHFVQTQPEGNAHKDCRLVYFALNFV